MRTAVRVVAIIAVGQALGWLLAYWAGPAPPRLSQHAQGDPALIASTSRHLGGDTLGFDAMAVAVVDEEGVRFATFGRQLDGTAVSPVSHFEIGSLTKPLTGLLLADLIDAGRLQSETTLAQASSASLPLEGEGANATLSRLARHRTGWPSLPVSMLPRALLLTTSGRNPYVGDPRGVLETAAEQRTSTGDQHYSNLGFAALGNALAEHERTDYATLLERRILTPLDMRDTVVLGNDDPLPEQHLQGHDSAGRSIEAWRASGWQAAGVGVWSTATDLSRLATAVLAGTAPGQRAIEPPPTDGGQHRLGFGWMIRDVDDHEVLWHNGGTGGFRSWFGLLQAQGRGVVVLSNTTRPVDALGLALLIDEAPSNDGHTVVDSPTFRWGDTVLVLLVVFGTAMPLARSVRHWCHGGADRLELVNDLASAVSILALSRILVAWERVPVTIWNLGAGFTMTCLLCTVLTWSTTPAVVRGKRPILRKVALVLLLGWSLFTVALNL